MGFDSLSVLFLALDIANVALSRENVFCERTHRILFMGMGQSPKKDFIMTNDITVVLVPVVCVECGCTPKVYGSDYCSVPCAMSHAQRLEEQDLDLFLYNGGRLEHWTFVSL